MRSITSHTDSTIYNISMTDLFFMPTTTDYSVQFEVQRYEVSEASNTLILFVSSTVVGSPSRNPVVRFTRNDDGPAIDDLIVNMTGRLQVEVQIPNDMIRTGDRTVNITLTTSDSLIIIGQESTAFINVSEDDPSMSYNN